MKGKSRTLNYVSIIGHLSIWTYSFVVVKEELTFGDNDYQNEWKRKNDRKKTQNHKSPYNVNYT